jgi:hypothetical protein
MKNISNPQEYNNTQSENYKQVCDFLLQEITTYFKNIKNVEGKIWHGSPVWFMDENPILSYTKQKKGVKLMFFSGADFEEKKFELGSGKFKDAGIFYSDVKEILKKDLKSWFKKAKKIQWDYKNVVKRKGTLVKL